MILRGRRPGSRRAGIAAAALALAFLLGGCAGKSPDEGAFAEAARGEMRSGPEGTDAPRRLKVVATLFPYYDFARQIAGDLADVEMVIPAGMDSHSFEPTPAHMRTIQEADVLICNGGAMEQWVDRVLEAVDASGVKVVTMMDYADAVEEEIVEGMEDEDDGGSRDAGNSRNVGNSGNGDSGGGDGDGVDGHRHGAEADGEHDGSETEYDEHIWTSPANAMIFVKVIAETLAEADPAHRDSYLAGQERYLAELERVHRLFLKVAEEKRRDLIVVADRFPFRYLAEEYGFGYRAAFPGCSTDTEPSAKTIAYLIEQVRQQRIPVVYYLELSTPRVAEIIREETGAEPLLLHSCHNVTRTELESGATYVRLMERNAENLRRGLVE